MDLNAPLPRKDLDMIERAKAILNLIFTKEAAECGAFAALIVILLTLPVGDGMNREPPTGNYVKAHAENHDSGMYALKAHED